MLLNAKALNETMDFIASTYELQPQTLLVCLSAVSVLEQEAEPPKKSISTEGYSFCLLTIISAKFLSYGRAEKNQEHTTKKKKRDSAYAYPTEVYCSFMLSLAAPKVRAEACAGRGSS